MIVLIIFILAVLVYKYLLHPYHLTPLSKIPNAHITTPLSTRWIESHRKNSTEVLALHALHAKHGPVVRLAPNELSVNSLAGLKTIYTGAFEKHGFYADVFVNFMTDNLVGMTRNAPHAEQKRMLSRVYAKSFLQECGDVRELSTRILFERLFPILHKVAAEGEGINVLPFFQAVGMDFTSSFLFGVQNATGYMFKMEEWGRWLEEYERFKYQSLQERYYGSIERWCLSLCEKMKEDNHPSEMSTNAVVYNQLRDSLEKKPDHRPIDLAIASELLDHLVAGHETTGITFTYMMWELSQRPELQTELRNELLTLHPQIKYPSEDRILPSASSIDSLPLLDALVRETLRVHSPAPGPLPRVTPHTASGISLNGYTNIPGGVRVSSSSYSLHRIAEVYPDPMEWRPERWLNPGPGKIHDMRRLFWPFGSGGRMCLGSNFALQEIKLVMAAVYSNYTTEIVDDEGIEQDYAFISLPRGRKLILKFTAIDNEV